MPIMLKKTHEKVLAHADAVREINHSVWRAHDQYVIEVERSINASLRAEIEAMKPDFELGRHVRTMRKAQDERRKAERAAKRAGI